MSAEPRAVARSQLIRMLAAAIVRDLMMAPAAGKIANDKAEDDVDDEQQQHANRTPSRALRAVQQRQPAAHVDR